MPSAAPHVTGLLAWFLSTEDPQKNRWLHADMRKALWDRFSRLSQIHTDNGKSWRAYTITNKVQKPRGAEPDSLDKGLAKPLDKDLVKPPKTTELTVITKVGRFQIEPSCLIIDIFAEKRRSIHRHISPQCGQSQACR